MKLKGSGSAVYTEGGSVEIYNSTIKSSSLAVEGWKSSNVIINSSEIEGNVLTGGSTITTIANNSKITTNTTGSTVTSYSSLELTDSEVVQNGTGVGLHIAGGTATVENSNIVSADGETVFVSLQSKCLDISNSVLTNISSKYALYAEGSVKINIGANLIINGRVKNND